MRIADFGLPIGPAGGLEFAEPRDGVAVELRIFEFAVDGSRTGAPRGLELLRQADDGDKLGRARGSGRASTRIEIRPLEFGGAPWSRRGT